MGFFKSLLFATALLTGATSARPNRLRTRNVGRGSCKSDRFTYAHYVGAKTNHFCESGYGGVGEQLFTVIMWSTADSVVGIQGIYSGGLETEVYGRQTNTSAWINANYNESVLWSHTRLWTGPNYEYVRAVNLSNSLGEYIYVGQDDPVQHNLTGYYEPVGGGLAFGFSGSTTGSEEDDELNGLRFLFAYSS